MKIYKIAGEKFRYIGQCDRLRCDDIGENNWRTMVYNHAKVSKEEFVSKCNVDAILDREESIEDFVAGDSDSYFAKSKWGNKDCYYLMTHGFEFIFVED